MIKIKKILAKIFIAVFIGVGVMPNAIGAVSNVPYTEISDYGDWLTPQNMVEFNDSLRGDMTEFQSEFQRAQMVTEYVPIEAKIGMAMINALSYLADVLDSSLVRFAIIFMILAYILWTMFEAYNMMTKGSSALDLGVNLVKKGAVVAIWSIILVQGPAQVFMWVMGPIISVATYMSDLILNSVVGLVGAQLPDTCTAIREYAMANTSANAIIDANAVANMLCVPTRLSGFFTTAVAAGWKWMIAGIGVSAFTMLVGAVFVVLFLYNAFKFALMGLGVIMDLFLGVFMLPFTAIAETINKTSYKGIVGDIFNGFLGLFKPESLSNQIQRFVNAAIYFVSLSILVALCMALMSWTVDANLATAVPTLESDNYITTLLMGLLVAYLANRTSEIAKNLGGSINDSFGKEFGGDVKKLWNKFSGYGKSVVGFFRKK